MYGKIFTSMYDGTLPDCWEALVTFQQMIALCTADGVVDMTPHSLSRRTGIPIEIIKKGIGHLESPDAKSRTPGREGRRIERLDDHRDWGWVIVNHDKYKKMSCRADKQEADRARIAQKRVKDDDVAKCRKVSQSVAKCRKVSQSVADVAHEDVDEDEDNTIDKSIVCKQQAVLHLVTSDEETESVPPLVFALVNGSYTLAPDVLERYKATYEFDVVHDLRKASSWLRDNRQRRQRTARGCKGFLTRWLNSTDDKHQRFKAQYPPSKTLGDKPRQPTSEEMEDLSAWYANRYPDGGPPHSPALLEAYRSDVQSAVWKGVKS